MPRIATIGMFDGVHRGHRHVIEQLSREGAANSLVPTVFTFDSHPLKTIAPERAPHLLGTMAQRARLLGTCGADEVVFMHFDHRLRMLTDRDFMRLLRDRYDVRALLIGFNHRFGYKSTASFADYVAMGRDLGITVIRCDELPAATRISSSAIRQLIAEGNIDKANSLLGHPFAIYGTVIHGRGIGHTIGFPTVNLAPAEPDLLLPGDGVYAATAQLRDGSTYPAMVNIGKKPTVSPDEPTSGIEAHLLGFEGDLYGQPVTLYFSHRIRDEKKFPSVDALRRQLDIDRRLVFGGQTKK